MHVDYAALELHDKATRGVPLSEEEQVQLDQWYAAQDNAEQAILNSGAASSAGPELQMQVTAVLEQGVTLA